MSQAKSPARPEGPQEQGLSLKSAGNRDRRSQAVRSDVAEMGGTLPILPDTTCVIPVLGPDPRETSKSHFLFF